MSIIMFENIELQGPKIISRTKNGDERGYLERLFCQDTLKKYLLGKNIKQINHTYTRKLGTVRGFHFQYPPYSELKIVSCLKGAVYDVALDLRNGSPTFLRHQAIVLSEDELQSYLIPEGFAHGFQTLTDDCEMLYLHTQNYNPDSEGSINAIDPCLKLDWPLPISSRSEKDENQAMISCDFEGVDIS